MTTITFKDDNINKIAKINVEGHAEYANKGSDIVCSAISSLTQYLYILYRRTGGIMSARLEPDNAVIDLTLNYEDTGSEPLYAFVEAIMMISLQYPDNVKLEVE